MRLCVCVFCARCDENEKLFKKVLVNLETKRVH